MSMKILRVFMLVAAIGTVVPMSAHAQGATANVSAAYIAGLVHDEIDGVLASSSLDLSWNDAAQHVELSGDGARTAHLRLNLLVRIEIGGVPVTLPVIADTDMYVGCNVNGAFVRLENLRAAVVLPFGGPSELLGEEELSRIREEAEGALNARTQAITNSVWEAIEDVDIEGIHKVCPTVVVDPDGSLHARFDVVNGCIDGDTKHHACGAEFMGLGRDFVCDNGLWVETLFDCEWRERGRRQTP